ncbi:MAG: sigma-70 family RNA polymerase sigma factor, partial [Solirubrobacterales bacterium]|nr:sigma-70 family RNA polymerase sigma factor [Solirubrobacterales bacterium]
MSVAAGAHSGRAPGALRLLGDERLARLAENGHERAFAVVYERHHQALYRYCRSILHNDADAQDALQSTFAAAFGALARGRRDAPIRPWLFRIAHNEAVSSLRHRRPTTELSAASEACTASVEDQVAQRAELGLLLGDLGKLTDRQRSALVMRELSDLSHEEIAISLGISVGAAKQTIYEARRSLFEFAEGRAMDCGEIRKTVSDADGRVVRARRVRAHLHECPGCAAFAAAIPARSAELHALAPSLPVLAAAGLLERMIGASPGCGAGVGLTTAVAGKTASMALSVNALAGAAVVATATVGVTLGIGELTHRQAHAARTGASAPAIAGGSRAAPALPPGADVALSDGLLPYPGAAARAAALHIPGAIAEGASHAAQRTAVKVGSASFGHAGAAPGHSGTTPSRSGSAVGHSGSIPGHSGSAPGHSGNAPGHSGNAPGHSGNAPGRSGNAPGHSG